MLLIDLQTRLDFTTKGFKTLLAEVVHDREHDYLDPNDE